MKKIKYLGLCASLLIVSPMASALVTPTLLTLSPQIVKADDTAYQKDLNKGFVDHFEITKSSLNNLRDTDLVNAGSTPQNGLKTINNNKASQVFEKSELYGNFTDEAKPLVEALQVKFLQQFVTKDAKLATLINSDYKTTVEIEFGSEIVPSSTNTVEVLKALKPGQSFKVHFTVLDSGNVQQALKTIKVTIAADTKIKLISPKDLQLNNNVAVTDAEIPSDIVNAVKSVNNSSTLTSTDFSNPFYYAILGKSEYQTLSGNFKFDSNGGAILSQLIPIKYTPNIAAVYDPSSFVALKNNKITTELPDPYATASENVYLERKIVIGNPNFPIFKYTSDVKDNNGNRIRNPLMNDSTLIPNNADKQNLFYRYNDPASLQKLLRYLNNEFQSNANGGGNFVAYTDVYSEDDQNKINIDFDLPDVKAITSPQVVIAKAYNPQNGKTSQIKIPVTVTDIPNSNLAPKVTKFPGTTVIVNSRLVSSYNPLSGVEATYQGIDNNPVILPKDYIKVIVTDTNGNNVNLNYDGTVPTTQTGTYKVHYVFSNPLDYSKSVTKDLTIKVVNFDLAAPTVTGFIDNAVYTLSNVSHKEVSPLAPLLGMSDVKATYKSFDGNTYTFKPSNIIYQIKNSAGQLVNLNEHNCIPMTSPQTYTITYIWANPEDPSKVTKKTSTLIVNAITSQPIVTRYTNDAVADPVIDTNTKSFNVLSNIIFSFSYTDPNSSTPLNTITETVPNNYVKVKVTKNSQEVSLINNSFVPTEGIYTITYTITNPKDNAKVSNYTRTLTVKKSDETTPQKPIKPIPEKPTVIPAQGIVWINYVPGYGINLWLNYNEDDGAERNFDGSYRKLEHGSAWKYSAIASYANGTQWYRLGNHQWVQDKYISFSPVTSTPTWQVTNQRGIGKVSYIPGYGINVWTSPDQKAWTKKLPHGSAWKYFKVAKKGNVTMYNLGGDQWVDRNYFVPQS